MENIPLEIICFYVARPRRSLENFRRRINQERKITFAASTNGIARKLQLPGLIMRKLKSTDRPGFWDHSFI
jgi:hypothetical protein